MSIKNYLPVLNWINKYNSLDFKGDLVAGITVGVMLIPQGMAYSMLAGLPPIYGLYASTIPLIIYALLGTSRQLAVGPVAMVSLLVASGVSVLTSDPSEYLAYAIFLALLVGIIQFLMGAFKLGFMVNFLSHPVISGFTSAAAIIIGFSQIKHLLGVEIPRTQFIHDTLYEVGKSITTVHTPTLILGIGSIVFLLIFKKYLKKIPGPMVVVALSVLLTWLFGWDQIGIKILKDVPAGLPSIGIPSVSLDKIGALFSIALPIALIGYMESIAVAKAIQSRKKNYQLNANQELIALGMANIVGSFFHSFPTTGGFSRTAVNEQAGARTGMASMISAIIILLTLLFLTSLFYFLPKAILAAVIMVAVFGLIDIKEPKQLWKSDRRDFVLLLITFILTLTTGVEVGILIGVLLSLSMVIYRAAYPHIAVLGKLNHVNLYRNIKRFSNAEEIPGALIVRVDAQMFFANASYIHDAINDLLEERKGIKLIILSAESVSAIDSSAIHMVKDLINELRLQKIDLYLAGATGPVRDSLHQSGIVEFMGPNHFFNFVDEAVQWFNQENELHLREDEKKIALQTNLK